MEIYSRPIPAAITASHGAPIAKADTIHANIDTPDLDTRTLGYTLPILPDLDVLAADTDRNVPVLYDRRTYDPDTLATIDRVLTEAEAATEG